MNTFDAIAHIRHEALSRTDAMRYLMEKLGFSAMYADEVVTVVFSHEHDEPAHVTRAPLGQN
jgi:hypothetical protein